MRNLGSLWSLLLALAALSAFDGATAYATQFETEAKNARLRGVQSSPHEFSFPKLGTMTCKSAEIATRMQKKAAPSLTLYEASYHECTLESRFGDIPVEVKMNSCVYQLEATGEEPFGGSLDISCPSYYEAIEIRGTGCAVSIPAQSLELGSHINTGEGTKQELDVNIVVSGLKYSGERNLCEGFSGSEGSYAGETTLRAFDEEGEQIGLRVSSPKYHSEAEHTLITGEQVVVNAFTIETNEATCEVAHFEGKMATNTSESLTIAPTYEECTLHSIFGEVPVEVEMNGCEYSLTGVEGVVHTETGSIDSEAGMEILCPEGKEIEVTGSGCQITVPAQALEGESTVSLTSEGSGETREIKVAVAGKEIYFALDEFACGEEPESLMEAAYTGTAIFKGFNEEEEQVGIWAT